MKIGIIGAGYVGREVGKAAIKAGHEVMLSNSREPETLFSLKYGLGCEVGTVADAAAFGDIVIAAIPLAAYRTIPVAPLEGKIVIDANNYYPERDGAIKVLDERQATCSEMLAAHLPTSRIIKAFNAIRMVDLEPDARPADAPDRRALPLAGDDVEGKAIVSGLYEAMGYDAVDAGPLSQGWRFERGRPVYCLPLSEDALETMMAETEYDDPLADYHHAESVIAS